MELTGLPSDIVDVLVSVICRLSYDFAMWGEGNVPLTIVCEEAHRYIPNDHRLGFGPTRRAISRIAKEGRKYSVSLCVVSQRPGELDPTILSQCSTVFSLRLSNEDDQQIVRAAITDAAASLLEFLPALGEREAIAFGDGVTLPMRFRFLDLPPDALPKGRSVRFTDYWRSGQEDRSYVDEVVDRWRAAYSALLEHEPAPSASRPSVQPEMPGAPQQRTEALLEAEPAQRSAAPAGPAQHEMPPQAPPAPPPTSAAAAPEPPPEPRAAPPAAEDEAARQTTTESLEARLNQLKQRLAQGGPLSDPPSDPSSGK